MCRESCVQRGRMVSLAPGKHVTSTQCCYNVGPPWPNIRATLVRRLGFAGIRVSPEWQYELGIGSAPDSRLAMDQNTDWNGNVKAREMRRWEGAGTPACRDGAGRAHRHAEIGIATKNEIMPAHTLPCLLGLYDWNTLRAVVSGKRWWFVRPAENVSTVDLTMLGER